MFDSNPLNTKMTVVILASILGLLVGVVTANVTDQKKSQSYCNSIESQVIQDKNISGTLACFEPGLVQVNLSEKVEKNSELRCVCRQEYEDIEQIIPISVSN